MNLGLESETVEFKKSTAELKEGIISLSAMLNKHGEGILYFGVKNNGDAIGQKDLTDNTVREVSRKISEGIKPQIIPTISIEYYGEIKIIKVEVKGNDIPYSAYGKYYSRSFDEDKQLSPALLKSLINREGEPDLIVAKASIKQNLTFRKLRNLYINYGIELNENYFEENMGLVNANGKYNVMAELLADENDLSIKVVTFAGKDKSVMLKRTDYGNKCLLIAVNNVLDYMESINETKVKVGRERKEEKYFDYNSFKEAWLNACVHTKWIEEIPPAVYIFDDRIEIVSNGGLPSNLTKEDFFKGISKPVNKRLLTIFRELELIDQTGHGVPLIVKKYGKEAFYVSQNTIVVTIPINKELLEKDYLKDEKELSNSEKIVLDLLKNEKTLSAVDLKNNTNFSESYIRKILSSLKEKQYIKRIGANKNGYWEII